MKTWMLVPVAAVALAVGLFTTPARAPAEAATTVHAAASATVQIHAPLIVRVAAADMAPDVMSDACVFSAEAMAAGAPAQCGAPKFVPVMIHLGEGSDAKALVWPGDFLEITANAAVEAWDATISFVEDLFGYAKENGLDI